MNDDQQSTWGWAGKELIVIDARTATDHFPGIGRYVVNLVRAMTPLTREGERLLLLRDPTASSWWDLKTIVGEGARVTDVPVSPFSVRQQWVIPRLLRRLQPDLYHSPYYLMPYRPGVPAVLTVYDLIPLLFPEHASVRARLFFRWTTALALRAATHVLAISEATRHDLLSVFRLSPEKVTVVPLAADPHFCPRPPSQVEWIRRKYGLSEAYIFYVGSNRPHKNLEKLIEAWAQVRDTNSKLVIAGLWDSPYPELRQQVEEQGLGESLRFLGPVPEEDLPAIYAGAVLFVFPSLYEGFGLPVLEAMACGVPVICSKTSSLQEVAGEAALLIDPLDVGAWAKAIRRALADEKLRLEMRDKGLAQARRFSWERTATQTLAVYRKLILRKGLSQAAAQR